jgi:peptidyl-prolyl cis-trans isomerase A (cyclophilin A)
MNCKIVAVVLAAAACLPAQTEVKKVVQDPKPAKAPNPKVLIKTSLGDITLELFADEAPKTVANFIGLAEGSKEFTDEATKKKVKRPFFDGLKFHRVIPNFMAQGGCPLGSGSGGPGYRFEDEINAKALGLDKVKAMENGQPNRVLLIRSQQDFQRMVLAPLFKKLGIKSQKELDDRRKDFEKAVEELTVMQVYENLGYKYDDSRGSHAMNRGTIAMANSGPNTNGSQFFINMVDNHYLNGKHTVFGRVIKGMEVVDKMQKVKLIGQSTPAEDIKVLSIRPLGKAGEPAKDKE